ncbi:hypothetical protein MVEN_01176400 [Mycena venus]|uniref:Uncharacterized protein n=1 Tax=Mycena venus TaxID=2733690 RepID=A0A8H6Y2J4_9AGAR|nr:hypothetical protein MVEN_01176400 [Mycena venus]
MTNTDSDNPDLNVVNVSTPPSAADFEVKTFDSKTGSITLVFGKFHLRSVRGNATQYYMVGENGSVARIDDDDAVQLGGYDGDLAIFNFVIQYSPSDVFTVPIIAHRDDLTTFERLSVDDAINIYVSEDLGPTAASVSRGILTLINTDSKNPDLTVVPANEPFPGAANFKVEVFDSKTGVIQLIYDDSPFKFRFRAVHNDPAQYHMVGKRDFARIDKNGSVQLDLEGGENLAIFSLVFQRPVGPTHRFNLTSLLATSFPNGRYRIRSKITGDDLLDHNLETYPLAIYPANSYPVQTMWNIARTANGHQISTAYSSLRYIQPAFVNQAGTLRTPPAVLRILSVPGSPGWYFIAIDTTSRPPLVLRNPHPKGTGNRHIPVVELNEHDEAQMWQFVPA